VARQLGVLDAASKGHGRPGPNRQSSAPFCSPRDRSTLMLTILLQMPVYTLLETPCSPGIQSRLYLTDDPALIVLYAQLRQMTLQTIRGASKITPRVEWEFVLHSAKLYDRMGCDLLGLDLGESSLPCVPRAS